MIPRHAILLWLAGSACKPQPATAPSPSDLAPHPIPTVVGPGAPTDLAPPPVNEPPDRPRRRMDIDQLAATLKSATGGIGWTEVRDGKEVDLWKDLSLTLGKPNFTTVITEDLTPTPIFQKFLDDAARSVCAKLMAREVDRPPPERVFLVQAGPEDTVKSAPDKIDANLQYLLLRYHGRSVEPGSPALEPWRWLFSSTLHVVGEPLKAWQAVCVGLVVHPEFYTY